MKGKLLAKVLAQALFVLLPMTVRAGSAGVSGGLTLLEVPNARPASLGEAFTASSNDIAAFSYNPASLRTIKGGQASFLYQKGLVEDSYGHLTIGGANAQGRGLGLSVGYYDAGDIELTDDSGTRSVNAQRDIAVSLGYASGFGSMSYGVAVKMLQSKLIEQYSATAYAADLGLMMPVGSRMNLGFAARNFGSEMKYIEEGDSLPRSLDAGLSMNLIPGAYNTTLMLNAPYYLNDSEVHPGVGLETLVGPLAIRAGYQKQSSVNKLTLGAGFMLGRTNVDYAFGLVRDLDSEHKVSLSMRFGNPAPARTAIEFSKKPIIEKPAVVERHVERQLPTEDKSAARVEKKQSLGSIGKPSMQVARRVYVVQAGDSMAAIARRVYGDAREWKRIYTANKHLMGNDYNIEPGQKLILP